MRAWQNLDRFEERASLKTWLYRIATNVCLDALSDRSRRFRPMEAAEAASAGRSVDRAAAQLLDRADPRRARGASRRESAGKDDAASERQAGVRDGAAAPAAAAARGAAVDGSARMVGVGSGGMRGDDGRGSSTARCSARGPRSPASHVSRAHRDQPEQALRRSLRRGVPSLRRRRARLDAARGRGDVDAAVCEFWLRGPDAIRGWLDGRGSICRGSRLVPIEASGTLAFRAISRRRARWLLPPLGHRRARKRGRAARVVEYVPGHRDAVSAVRPPALAACLAWLAR